MISAERERPRRRSSTLAEVAAVVATLVLPPIVLLLWERSPAASYLLSSLLALGLDRLRSDIVAALLGALLAGLVAALVGGRPLLAWLAAGLAFAGLFVAALPARLGPQPLPHEVVDTTRMAVAVFGLSAMGFAAGGLGAGVGVAVRAAAAALWGLRYGFRRSRLLLLPPAVVLLGVSTFGVVRAPGILLNGPWEGVTEPSAVSGSDVGLSPGRRVDFSYRSSAFNATRKAIVMLPAGYDSDTSSRFPVLYLLHGSPGSVNDWPQGLGAAQIEASARASGAPALILVSVDGVGPRGGSNDSFANGYVPGDDMESDLIENLLPAVDRSFRTLANRQNRGIGGLSTGGYGAANLALRHPDLFRLAIVLSIDPLEPEHGSFGGNAALQRANDPLLLARTQAESGSPAFFVGWGTSDPAAGQSEQFVRTLQQHGYTVMTDPVPGGHEPAVWESTLYQGLVSMGHLLAPSGHR